MKEYAQEQKTFYFQSTVAAGALSDFFHLIDRRGTMSNFTVICDQMQDNKVQHQVFLKHKNGTREEVIFFCQNTTGSDHYISGNNDQVIPIEINVEAEYGDVVQFTTFNNSAIDQYIKGYFRVFYDKGGY